jgi:acetyl esterase/lipase
MLPIYSPMQRRDSVAQQIPITARRLVYAVPGMAHVQRHSDIVYTQRAAGGDLLMDVYTPPDLPAGAKLPGVICIHGGPVKAHRVKDWGAFVAWGELLAASGLIGVTFDHHYHTTKALEAAALHIQAALTFIRARSDAYHLDPDRLGLLAFSGGGPFLSAALRDQPGYVRCLAAYYALLDLRAGRSHASAIREAFSPSAFLTAGSVPVLVARAGRDRANINASIDSFVAAGESVGAPVTRLAHPTGRHGFDIMDDDDQSRAIIAATVEFFLQHV